MNKNWIQIRYDLYQKVRDQVAVKLGTTSAEIRSYQSSYEKEFGKKWRAMSASKLFQKISDVDVVFLADFHALQQSQKSHLRILKKAKSLKRILLMECFDSDDQEVLDDFLSGRISEKAFLEAVNWQKSWTFPWAFYKPLLKWAMLHKVRVFGLNCGGKKSLKDRDIHAVRLIKRIKDQFPEHQLFVQYGDLHIAESRIPRMLKKACGGKLSYLKIHQNSEELYFALLRQELETRVDLIEIDANTFCLMNVPPWVKWQNYLFYLERYVDGSLRGKKSFDGIDYTDHVGAFVGLLSKELQFAVSTANLAVFTADDRKIWTLLRAGTTKAELANYQFMIEEGISFYFGPGHFGFLARSTVNHAAQLATQYIWSELHQNSRKLNDFPDDFLALIWSEGLAYFGTKLVNHRRKTDTLFDIKSSLAQSKTHEFGKDALLLALSQKTKELLVLAGKVNARLSYKPRRKKAYFIAARLLGGLIGEKLYNGFRKKRISLNTVQNYFQISLEDKNFDEAYFKMLKTVEALPLHFKSKTERL